MLECRDNETDNDEYEAFLRYQHSWRSQKIPSFGEYPLLRYAIRGDILSSARGFVKHRKIPCLPVASARIK